MSLIREKRKITFDNKRITPEIIRNLAHIIEQEASGYKNKNGGEYFLTFSVDANDNSSYESQSIEIFEPNILIDKKVLQKINMRFNTVDFSRNIELQILHIQKDENSSNFILVGGEDSNWVNGVIARLSEAIDLAKPQPRISIKLVYFSWTLIVLLNVAYFIPVWPYLIKQPAKQSTLIDFTKIILLFGLPIISLFWGESWGDNIQELYPSIEIQTGPEYLQIEKSKRNRLTQLFLIIIVPLVLTAFYDLAKHFLT